jgi:hypothetical protein
MKHYLSVKDQGGLGIEVLDIKNKCLINEGGVWPELLHNNYLNNKTLSQVEVNSNDSPF